MNFVINVYVNYEKQNPYLKLDEVKNMIMSGEINDAKTICAIARADMLKD